MITCVTISTVSIMSMSTATIVTFSTEFFVTNYIFPFRDAIHFALGKDWDNHVDISVMDGDQDSGDVIALKVQCRIIS